MHLDHIVPLAAGGERLDASNVQWLCIACHSVKTAREDGGFGKVKTSRIVDGGHEAGRGR